MKKESKKVSQCPWLVTNVPDIVTSKTTLVMYELFNKSYGLGTIGYVESEEDAQRIVACVNACDGISNERLTSINVSNDSLFEAIELENKYQELKNIVEDVLRLIDGGSFLGPQSIMVGALRQSIK